MAIVTKDQVKMLLQTIKHLDLEVQEVTLDVCDDCLFTLININGLRHLIQMNKKLFEFDNLSILDSTTDLVSGVYEGGFKLWECSIDLLKYLLSNDTIKLGRTVCDLGCGGGLLGIFALKKGASSVHFLDYNREVLQWFTLPNILNNLSASHTEEELIDCVLERSHFYPGDWTTVNEELNDVKYDLIMSSETIYKKENYLKLLNLIKNHLKSDGIVLIAAKVYYFGLNGGCFDFIEFVEEDGVFNVEVVKTIDDNLQRNILMLTFKNQSRVAPESV